MKMNIPNLCLRGVFAALFVLLLASSFRAVAQTSENNAELREGLARFPEADTDKDGILTMK